MTLVETVRSPGAPAVMLVLAYLSVHLGMVLAAPRRPRRDRLLAFVDVALGFLFYWLLGLSRQGWLAPVWVLWATLIFFWWAYTWAGHTLECFHPPSFSLDPILIAWEKRICQPSLRLARHGSPVLTELLQFCYASYYLYTPALGLYLHLAGRTREFESMALAVLFGYAVSYPSFALLPVWGPRWGLLEEGVLARAEQPLEGYWFTRQMNRLAYSPLAHKGGAMPSSHSSTALVFLIWCWRLGGPAAGVPAAVLVTGMWIGAVYGRYHYAVDVAIGALLGLGGVWVADHWVMVP